MCYFTLRAATRYPRREIARAKRFSRFLRDFITICLSLKHASRSCSLLPRRPPPQRSAHCLLTLSCLDTYLTVEVHPREKRDGEAYFKWRVFINKFIWPFFSSLSFSLSSLSFSVLFGHRARYRSASSRKFVKGGS